MRFAGQVALITGASRNPGLGREIALAFAAEGASIALCGGTKRDVLESNAADLRATGASAVALSCDLTRGDETRRMVATAISKFERIDILVNCASGRGDLSLLELPYEEWRKVLAVNLDGAFHCVQAVAPHMIEHQHGRIINIASISGQAGDRNRAHVVTAKAGLIGFTKAIAMELGRHGITANAVSPGLIDTPRAGGAGLEQRRKRIAESPLGRAGKSSDITSACLYLASQEAAFITGQTLSVNGGAWFA